MHERLQLLSAGPRRQASARTSAESDEACQRKTKDRADGMREKNAHCPRRDSNLYLWDTRPQCFRLHHDGRHASRHLKQTLQTLTRQLDRETIMHETLQLLSAGPRRQASARTSAESDEACQRKTKDRADGMREKSAHCPRRDSNLYLWDTRPQCFRLHHDGRHASRHLKQTLQTLTRQLDRETIMHETLQLLSAGPRRQASARTSAESDVCVCVRACVYVRQDSEKMATRRCRRKVTFCV